MYAVIFKATIKDIDDQYFVLAKKMRDLACKEYNCLDFVSVCENNQEISISYWNEELDITRWKENREHLNVQRLAKEKWYQSYSVEIVKVIRTYSK